MFPSVFVLQSLGVFVDRRNNARVWGRQSAFWEYLWCLPQHWPFLLLTVTIHLQGQYAVLTACDEPKEMKDQLGHLVTRRATEKVLT